MRPDPVIYQIYPRSFQDSDGDGVGDLNGIRARLDHLSWLGVDAAWLSPIYPSPMHDFGYDVSDYTNVDPVFGDLDDFDELTREAGQRGLAVLLDVVPCHTSIEHPWFRDHPDWYIWADAPNNWSSAFGGSAWEPYDGRYYLHSFYREQPDLDWRNPEVVAAMQDVLRFWLDRGAAGYRIDAIDRLMKDPQLRDDPAATEPFGLPLREDEAKFAPVHSRNAPGTEAALAGMRAACGDEAFLVGEVYLPSVRWEPYTTYFDAVFAFELLHSPWRAGSLRAAIAACVDKSAAWVMSNHDFGRLATRFGAENARAAALLLLTLPGPAFLYQGDEIGQRDGPPGESGHDRAGRDRYRHPMQWDASPSGGFTSGEPWLPLVDPGDHNVADQRLEPASTLCLVRDLIALRRDLSGGFELIESAEAVLAFRRGDHVVAINTGPEPTRAPARGEPVLATRPVGPDGVLSGHAGAVWGLYE